MNKVIVLISTFVCLAERIAAIDVCQRSELGSLLTNSNTTSCATDSSVVFSSLNGAPSDEQLATICETDTCRSLMATILVINPEDCILPLNENLNLMSDLVGPVVEKCTSMGIDITGSSKVGSDVNVGDDSVAFDSNAQRSAIANTLIVTLSAILAFLQ